MVPDFCEPIVAWRIWQVGRLLDRGAPVLRGLGLGERITWPAHHALEAVHVPQKTMSLLSPAGALALVDVPHVCRASPCDDRPGCGLYGVKAEGHRGSGLLKTLLMQEGLVAGGACPVAIGEVWLWGRIVEHEAGYRAQFGYPKKVVWGVACDAAAVAAAYGVPYEEDPSWKSVGRLDDLSPNPSRLPYLSPSLTFSLPRFPMFAPFQPPSPPSPASAASMSLVPRLLRPSCRPRAYTTAQRQQCGCWMCQIALAFTLGATP